MADESQVCSFYEGKKILITGATGFMGKVLVWKLLHSCHKLDTIYVLIRSKYGKSPMSRKSGFFGSLIFNDFKKNNPEILAKVVLVSGDVGEEGLGLSDKDRKLLIDDVSVVFHSAAILKMNLDLRTAVTINTIGTIRMLDLARQMKKLQAFVHVSTAFCCCENSAIEEKIYPSKHNAYDIIKLVQWMDPEILEKITPKLIHPSPNTYIYSKRLSESVLQNYASEVPIIVARPSIVIGSFKEPLEGWCDTFNGPVGFFVAGARGVIRTTLMNMRSKTDVIPADMAINSIVILPWANQREELLNQISVYNITQNSYEDLTWLGMKKYLTCSFLKYPFDTILWYPNLGYTEDSVVVYKIKDIFLHYLPAYVIDFALKLAGQKPFLINIHDRIHQAENLLTYFTRKQWIFVHDKVLQLEQILNDTDRKLFPVNMKDISDFQSYMDDILVSCKTRIFKEDMKMIGKAKRTLKIMYAVDKIVLVLKYYLLWKILMAIFNVIMVIFNHTN
ncbi:putative fatty acyl-CoA reductase CG5065 [Planococcus citri]|uniref:putative fatty acyl-CoA reductase CG5065 n=1 Tax=Planococcus citri TaxID=170843 RepID=UPI0031F8D216